MVVLSIFFKNSGNYYLTLWNFIVPGSGKGIYTKQALKKGFKWYEYYPENFVEVLFKKVIFSLEMKKNSGIMWTENLEMKFNIF